MNTRAVIELALWCIVFVALFAHAGADANLLFVTPVVLVLIALRMAGAVVADAFASVWRGLIGR